MGEHEAHLHTNTCVHVSYLHTAHVSLVMREDVAHTCTYEQLQREQMVKITYVWLSEEILRVCAREGPHWCVDLCTCDFAYVCVFLQWLCVQHVACVCVCGNTWVLVMLAHHMVKAWAFLIMPNPST